MTHALDVHLLLEHHRLESAVPTLSHAVLRLEATGRPDLKRPPLDLLACIDVSGSMEGRKLEEVKRALIALSDELSASDRLGVTTFQVEVCQALPPTAMDAEGKAKLREAVRRLAADGSTCMSGGLLGAVSDLKSAPAPAAEAVRRVLLFTDGHANSGIAENDRAGWAALLAQRLEGFSVSWFGFGEDHDAEFLSTLADQSRGNAYVAKDADAITDAFAQELGGLLGARAMELELEVFVAGGALKLLNDERSEHRGDVLLIRVDELSCEERKDLLVELSLPAAEGGTSQPVKFVARWRDVLSGQLQTVSHEATLAFSRDGRDAAHAEVREVVALVFAANAQRRARAFAEQGRWSDAVAVMQEAVVRLEQLGTEKGRVLAAHLRRFTEDYGDDRSYLSSRSRLKSAERAMSKQKGTGSELDGVYISALKRQVQVRFKK